MVRDLLVKSDNDTMDILYYFCDHADSQTLQPENLYRTLLKQLFHSGRLCEQVIEMVVRTFYKHANGPHERELAEMLHQAIKASAATYIVLDGLDECAENSQRSMVDQLCRFASFNQPSVKIFITCRDEERPLKYLHKFMHIHLSATAIEDDIKLYISGVVRSSVDSCDITLRDPALENEIVAKLTAKAQGM